MTCIVGLAERGRVYIGGDSCSSVNGNIFARAIGKVFRTGEVLMGSSGTTRFNNIVRYTMKLPAIRRPLDRFMAVDFADAVRRCLKEAGYLSIKDSVEQSEDDAMVVGVRGSVYYCDSFFAVSKVAGGVWACGSGRDLALGALYATPHLSPRRRVRLALEAAERWDNGVARPFHIKSA